MGPAVAGMLKLIQPVGAAIGHDLLDLILQKRQVLARDLPRLGVGGLGNKDHLGAKRPHHESAFFAVSARHDGNEAPPLRGAYDRGPCARIAAGELDHGLVGLQRAASDRIGDDLAGDTILFRPAGIEVIQLGQNSPGKAGRYVVQRNQGRSADGLDSGLQNRQRHGQSLCGNAVRQHYRSRGLFSTHAANRPLRPCAMRLGGRARCAAGLRWPWRWHPRHARWDAGRPSGASWGRA